MLRLCRVIYIIIAVRSRSFIYCGKGRNVKHNQGGCDRSPGLLLFASVHGEGGHQIDRAVAFVGKPVHPD